MIIGMHQKYDDEGQLTTFLSTGKKLSSSLQIAKWLQGLRKTTVMRLVNPSSFNPLFPKIVNKGAKIEYAYWHSTKIPKGSEPPEIARLLAEASADIFHPLFVREELTEMRKWVDLRRAIVDLRSGMSNRVYAVTGSTVRT